MLFLLCHVIFNFFYATKMMWYYFIGQIYVALNRKCGWRG